MLDAEPPLPEVVVEPVLVLPDVEPVSLLVPVLLPPVDPPLPPLPEVVVEPLLTEPPLPPLPVEPELPDVADELQLASPTTEIAMHDEEFPPVLPELPDEPPLAPLTLLLLVASPPLPPLPPSPVVVDELFELDEFDELSPPLVVEPALDEPPEADPWPDLLDAEPPLPEVVVEPVLVLPDVEPVSLLVPVLLPPVDPPLPPLPEVVVEPLLTEPPLPPLPVEPELPEPEDDSQLAFPVTEIAVQDALLSPVDPEFPDDPPLPPLTVFVLEELPPLPPVPPLPVFVDDELLLPDDELLSPPFVVEPAEDEPPTTCWTDCTTDVSCRLLVVGTVSACAAT